MTKESQSAWPTMKPDGTQAGSPTACFLAPDGKARSDRSPAGPLRLGTAPGIGPRGSPPPGSSDFGMDRVSPRGFDPLGTSDTRAPEQEASRLISKEIRSGYGKRGK